MRRLLDGKTGKQIGPEIGGMKEHIRFPHHARPQCAPGLLHADLLGDDSRIESVNLPPVARKLSYSTIGETAISVCSARRGEGITLFGGRSRWMD